MSGLLYACLPGQPGRWYSGVRKIYEASATAAIAANDAALSEAGLVIVPIEPTEKMRDAGIGTGKCDSSDLQPAEPETVWRAMAAAAQGGGIDVSIERAAEAARQTLRMEIRKAEGNFRGPTSEGYAQEPPLLPWDKVADYEREAWCLAMAAGLAAFWQPIDTLPGSDAPLDVSGAVARGEREPLVLAKTADGRRMIWRPSILRAAMKEGTPAHLGFPAIAWMFVPE